MSEGVQRSDVVIIGAGPAGLFAAFQCGMLHLSTQVVDALDEVGGQCSALYPEKPIYDIPAHPSILAGDLIDHLHRQAKPFHPRYHLGQQVVSMVAENGLDGGSGWRLTTSLGLVLWAKTVILAAGAGAFGPHRPPLDNLESFEGRSVFYMVRRRQDFAGKRIIIAGGGDSAVDWALSLAEIAASVALVHRRAKFRAAPESAARLAALAREGRVELVTPYQLAGLEGGDGQLTGVRIATLDGAEKTLPADVLLPFFGLSMELGPILEWGLGMHHHHVSVDPATCATTLPGVFAIGDVCTYPGKLKLILTGFAEAAVAAHAARRAVYPGEELHFEYSTSRGAPKA